MSTLVFDTILGERVIDVAPSGRKPVATLLFVHGLGDHPGRLIASARRLASRGYRTVLLELKAHGGHACERSASQWVYDFYAELDDASALVRAFRHDGRAVSPAMQAACARQYDALAQTLIADHLAQLDTLMAWARQRAGGTPIFVGGHSMGGLVALESVWRLALREPAAIAGLVLLAPALRPQGTPDSPLLRVVVNGLWTLRRAPVSLTRSAFKAALHLNFPIDTNSGNKWVSDQPEEVGLFETDPLIPHRVPTRYASSIESQMAATEARGDRFPVDGLVLVPARDGITSREAAVDFVDRVNRAAGTRRLTLAQFPVTAHDLLRSSMRSQALDVLTQWMDERVARA